MGKTLEKKKKAFFQCLHAYTVIIFSNLEIIFYNLTKTGHVATEYEYYRLLFCILI